MQARHTRALRRGTTIDRLSNAQGWAPEVIDFGWRSYRALNIYVSLVLVTAIASGLLRGAGWSVPLLAAFALFHGIEGVLIAFWAKAALQLATLVVLAWSVVRAAPARGGHTRT